jgi:hypothetical protein
VLLAYYQVYTPWMSVLLVQIHLLLSILKQAVSPWNQKILKGLESALQLFDFEPIQIKSK